MIQESRGSFGVCSRNPLSIVSGIVQSDIFDLVTIPRACDLILIRPNFVVCPFFYFESILFDYVLWSSEPIIFKFEIVQQL